MSEDIKKPERTLEQINQEYTALCAQAGQKQYQIQCAQEDLKALNSAIRRVNNEGAAVQQYEAAVAAKRDNVTDIKEGTKSNA